LACPEVEDLAVRLIGTCGEEQGIDHVLHIIEIP
jgi:hypothetical protein